MILEMLFFASFHFWEGEEGTFNEESSLPVLPIKNLTNILCTLSEISLPLTTVRSHNENCFSFSAFRAARNRATFCAGVSPGGAAPFGARLCAEVGKVALGGGRRGSVVRCDRGFVEEEDVEAAVEVNRG